MIDCQKSSSQGTVLVNGLTASCRPTRDFPGEHAPTLVDRVDQVVVSRFRPVTEGDKLGSQRLERLDGRVHRPPVMVVTEDQNGLTTDQPRCGQLGTVGQSTTVRR